MADDREQSAIPNKVRPALAIGQRLRYQPKVRFTARAPAYAVRL